MANRNYVLITDDGSDLPRGYCTKNNIEMMYLSYSIDGVSYTSAERPPSEFYAEMRSGKMPVTAQVSVESWRECFENHLDRGQDILYLAFSSRLSGTCSSAQVAARELKEQYPGREIIVVDTLCASLGQGLLTHKVAQMRDNGADIFEAAKWAEENKLRVSHMVAVEDLMHLHRGGRISKTTAVAGSLLGIRPIIHMNDNGELVSIDRIRGRKQSLNRIVKMSERLLGNSQNDIVMVSHSDCEQDAKYVADMVCAQLNIKRSVINYIGPVIGSHTGPDTVAVFLMADSR